MKQTLKRSLFVIFICVNQLNLQLICFIWTVWACFDQFWLTVLEKFANNPTRVIRVWLKRLLNSDRCVVVCAIILFSSWLSNYFTSEKSTDTSKNTKKNGTEMIKTVFATTFFCSSCTIHCITYWEACICSLDVIPYNTTNCAILPLTHWQRHGTMPLSWQAAPRITWRSIGVPRSVTFWHLHLSLPLV